MPAIYYGAMRLPEPQPVPVAYQTVEPLPPARGGLSEPRRLRNFTCPHLRVGGKQPGLMRHLTSGSSGYDIKDAYCTLRHVEITGSLVVDLCGCSFSRECPFLPEVPVATVAAIAPTPPHKATPLNAKPRICLKCKETKPAAEFPRYVPKRGSASYGRRCLACTRAYTRKRTITAVATDKAKTRAQKMLKDFQRGLSYAAIGQKYNVGRALVGKALRLARDAQEGKAA